jgi:Holliday junction resolvase
MRRRARRDDNHRDIVATFRACHASVLDTASLGNGAPDLIIGYNKQTVLVEVKDGSKPPSKRKLTLDEVEFMNTWRGKYVIIESVDDVIALLRELA